MFGMWLTNVVANKTNINRLPCTDLWMNNVCVNKYTIDYLQYEWYFLNILSYIMKH